MNEDNNNLWREFPAAVAQWLRSRVRECHPDDEVNGLLSDLSPWIDQSQIVVEHGNQHLFDTLEEKFPIGFNRIEWRGVEDHWFINVLNAKSGQSIASDDEISRLLGIRSELHELFRRSHVGDSTDVVWFGDDYDVFLRMSLSTFLECYVLLFSTPQHNYLVPNGCDWCLNYTMEGGLYFGLARKSVATGPVNFDTLE